MTPTKPFPATRLHLHPLLLFLLAGCGVSERPAGLRAVAEPTAMPVVEPALPEILAYEPWTLAEDRVAHTLVVDIAHPEAANDNPGTDAQPLASIQSAVERAFQTGSPSEGVRIRIHPGIYRETVDIVDWDRDAPLLLEGYGEGEVVLSGSDLFSAWSATDETPAVFRHAWTLKLGPEKNPWPGLMPMREGESFRRELLFVDGVPMRQVQQRERLEAGCYLVDESAEQILFHPPAGIDPRRARVEVSVRPEPRFGAHSKLLRVAGSRNIALRRLVLQHAATLSFNSAALQFLAPENLLVEDCEIRWNNGEGISLTHHQNQSPRNVVLRRVRANHNGTLGMTGGMHNGLIEDCETSHNNWRGAAMGATGWAPCGFKLSGIHRLLLRNHTANFNHASGGWFDDHITHVTVENFTGINNLRAGITFEASDGPVLVRGARLLGNSTGVNLFDSVNVHVDQSVMLNNSSRAIRIAGSLPLSEEALLEFPEGWRRNRLRKRRSPQDIGVFRSVLGHTGPASNSFVVEFGMREDGYETADGSPSLAVTLATLRLSGNTYGLPEGQGQAGFKDLRNQTISLDAWQKLTGQDGDARWDPAVLARALEQAVQETGLQPTGIGSSDPTRGNRNVDALEL